MSTREDREKRRREQIEFMASGIKQPMAPEIEASILGALMIDNDAAFKVNFEDLSKIMYLTTHKKIAEAMGDLFKEGTPIDTVTLYEKLKKKNEVEEVGGAVYLSKLSQGISSSANITHHMKIVYEKAILRGIITSAHKMAQDAYEGSEDAFDILEKAHISLDELIPGKIQPLKDHDFLNERAEKEFRELLKRSGKPSISMGYPEFDAITHGVHPGEMSLLAARSEQGKSTVALNIAAAIAEQGIHVAYFSFEASHELMLQKLWAKYAQIDSSVFRMHNTPLTKDELNRIKQAQEHVKKLPIYIDDDNPNLEQLIYKVGALKRKNPNMSMVIIDNLQGFISRRDYWKKEEIVKEIVLASKYEIAKNNNVHTMLLCQIDTSVEDLNKNPLSYSFSKLDLQDIKNTNLDATPDYIIYLYRPEQYFPDKSKAPDKLKDTDYMNKMYVITEKDRVGERPPRAPMGYNRFFSDLHSLTGTQQK